MIKRGDIFWAEFAPRSGSEQTGVRPALVLSDDRMNVNPRWRSIVVVPFSTSAAQARRGPTAIAIAPGSSGLTRESVALCHQITTLDRSKFRQRIGTLDFASMTAVEDGVRATLDMG